MGRHSQTSSLSTTLAGLGSMAAKKRTAPGAHGRRRAEGPAKTALTPMLFKAGGAAAAFSLAVSGAAYAAISAGGDEGHSSSGGSFGLIGGEADGKPKATEAPEKQGAGKIASAEISTTTVDEPQVHGTVQKESDALPKGETKVETAGVDGLVRTTYEITTQDGKEISRTPVAQVVVTQKVDEVVLVGTGAAKKQEQPQSQEQTPAPSAPSDSSGSSGGSGSSGSSGGSADSGGSASGGSAGTTGGDVGDDVWAKLAQCESGGNPQTNTGNGFYGMYQFTLETWQALGGTGYPHEADAATQTAMAKKLQAQSGWGQWPGCADKLGLR